MCSTGCTFARLCQWGPNTTSDLCLKERSHFKPFALGTTGKHKQTDNH